MEHVRVRDQALLEEQMRGETAGFMDRDKVRPERALQLLAIDPHAPAEFRANGAALNHDGFHAAFVTRPGDRMYKPPDERIRIW